MTGLLVDRVYLPCSFGISGSSPCFHCLEPILAHPLARAAAVAHWVHQDSLRIWSQRCHKEQAQTMVYLSLHNKFCTGHVYKHDLRGPRKLHCGVRIDPNRRTPNRPAIGSRLAGEHPDFGEVNHQPQRVHRSHELGSGEPPKDKILKQQATKPKHMRLNSSNSPFYPISHRTKDNAMKFTFQWRQSRWFCWLFRAAAWAALTKQRCPR